MSMDLSQYQSSIPSGAIWWNNPDSNAEIREAIYLASRSKTDTEYKIVHLSAYRKAIKFPKFVFNTTPINLTTMDNIPQEYHNVMIGYINVWHILSFRYHRDAYKSYPDMSCAIKKTITDMLLSRCALTYAGIPSTMSVRACARCYADEYVRWLKKEHHIPQEANGIITPVVYNDSDDSPAFSTRSMRGTKTTIVKDEDLLKGWEPSKVVPEIVWPEGKIFSYGKSIVGLPILPVKNMEYNPPYPEYAFMSVYKPYCHISIVEALNFWYETSEVDVYCGSAIEYQGGTKAYVKGLLSELLRVINSNRGLRMGEELSTVIEYHTNHFHTFLQEKGHLSSS